jgi:peroxiredoxin
MKRLIPALFVALAASGASSELPPAKFGSVSAGAVVPDFKMLDPSGRDVRLSDFKERVLVVNFWSTNRGPADVLQNAFLQYEPLGIAVLGVCSNATREEFDAWVAKHKSAVAYPLTWDPAGKTRSETIAQKHFGVGVFPATVVLGRESKFVGGFVGFGAATPVVLRSYLRDAGAPIPPEPEPAPPTALVPPPPRDDSTLKAGSVAPEFASVDLQGAPVKLSDFAGRIVVLDFWATWCGPCIVAMPHTQKVAAATKSQGVVIFASCTSDTRVAFEAWLRENAARYPDVIFADDPNSSDKPAEQFAERASAKLYGVSGLPTQFVIGRDGKVFEVIRGYGPNDTRLEESLSRLGIKFDRL